MWDVKGGGALATLHGHKGGVTAAAWNDNGNWLLTAARDATLKVPSRLRAALDGLGLASRAPSHFGWLRNATPSTSG